MDTFVLPVIADLGGGDLQKAFNGIVGSFGILIAIGAACCLAWFLRDVFRFGRDGFSWFIAVVLIALFSGIGYWIAGYVGILFSLPVLIAFAFGRRAAHRKVRHD